MIKLILYYILMIASNVHTLDRLLVLIGELLNLYLDLE